MANYITCANNVDIQTVMTSLIGKITATGLNGVRILSKTIDTDLALACASDATLEDLFRQCIGLAADGLPALRIVSSNYVSGAGTESAWSCATGQSWQDVTKQLFCMTTEGEMAIRLLSIT